MAENKKILFVSNTLWSIYHFRFFTIESLIADGYDVVILTPPGNLSEHFRNIPGLQYIPLQWLQPKGMSPWKDYLLFTELKRQYKRINPALIIHYTVKPNIYGCMAAKFTGHKAIAVVTGKGYTLIKKGMLQTIVERLYQRAFQNTLQVWFLNEGDRQWFADRSIVTDSKTFILPGEGIDTGHFHREKEKDHGSEKTIFLMIARVLKNKGVKEYAEAANRILNHRDDTEFHLLGRYEENIPDAVPNEEFSAWIQKNLIIYHPYTDDVKKILEDADCFILPSYSEGLSVSVMEAASMELPVIVSDIPGCRELVKDGITGFLVPPGDVLTLAGKIETFMSLSAGERREMGRQGRKLMTDQYDQHIISGIYKEKIREFLQEE